MSERAMNPIQHSRTITSPRFCTWCPSMLTGQTVEQDAPTRLWIVTCPGCGRANAASAFPVTGRAPASWRLPLACILLAWLLLFMLGSAVTIGALSIEMGWGGADRHAAYLAQRVANYRASLPSPPDTNATGGIDSTGARWLATQDRGQLIVDQGGLLSAIDWWQAWEFAGPGVVTCFVLGALWSLFMPGRRVVHRCLLAGATGLLGALIFLPIMISTLSDSNSWYMSEWAYARQSLTPVLAPMGAVALCMAMAIGLLAGRPLARRAVRALLPPGLRAPFAPLWSQDGHLPPRGVRQVRLHRAPAPPRGETT